MEKIKEEKFGLMLAPGVPGIGFSKKKST